MTPERLQHLALVLAQELTDDEVQRWAKQGDVTELQSILITMWAIKLNSNQQALDLEEAEANDLMFSEEANTNDN